MKKILVFIWILFIPFLSNAISVNELRQNSSQYTMVYSNETSEVYVDNTTILVSRYNPPYYVINATLYSIFYDTNYIVQTNQTSFFNYERSAKMLAPKYENMDDFVNAISNDNGVNWRINTITIFDFDGNILKATVSYPSGKAPTGKTTPISPAYQVAMYIFYKSYNMYFNYPLPNQLF